MCLRRTHRRRWNPFSQLWSASVGKAQVGVVVVEFTKVGEVAPLGRDRIRETVPGDPATQQGLRACRVRGESCRTSCYCRGPGCAARPTSKFGPDRSFRPRGDHLLRLIVPPAREVKQRHRPDPSWQPPYHSSSGVPGGQLSLLTQFRAVRGVVERHQRRAIRSEGRRGSVAPSPQAAAGSAATATVVHARAATTWRAGSFARRVLGIIRAWGGMFKTEVLPMPGRSELVFSCGRPAPGGPLGRLRLLDRIVRSGLAPRTFLCLGNRWSVPNALR